MNALGLRIRELRDSKGLTQLEVAQAAGLSQSYLSRIEKGQLVNPASGIVARLAAALGVPVALLYVPGGAEALVLRAELQMTIEQALHSGGDPRQAVDKFVARLGLQSEGATALGRWGHKLVESYTALGQLAGHEKELGGEVMLTGEYGEGCLQAAGEPVPLPAGTLEALMLASDALLPGAHRGDYALLARNQSVRYGDLALVEHAGETLLRRIFYAGEGEIDLVHPDGVSPPLRLRRDEVGVLGRIAGLLFRSQALDLCAKVAETPTPRTITVQGGGESIDGEEDERTGGAPGAEGEPGFRGGQVSQAEAARCGLDRQRPRPAYRHRRGGGPIRRAIEPRRASPPPLL